MLRMITFARATAIVAASGTAVLAADGKCRPVPEELRAKLSRYVERKLGTRTAMKVAEISPVEETCYRRMRFVSADVGNQRPLQITLYLSPDQRFLAREILDSSLDPTEEERRKQAGLKAGLSGNFPVLGDPGALVSITVFSDFQCPYCKLAAETLRGAVIDQPGRVKLVFRNLPLSQHAWARIAAESVGCLYQQSNDAVWIAHDFIFDHQQELTVENVVSAVREVAAKIPVIDIAQYDRCIVERSSSPQISRDVEFADSEGVNATPTIFVNKLRVQGIGSREHLLTLVNQG